MKKYILLFLAAILFCINAEAQTGTAYGFKGGLTLGSQKWNNQERELLPAYHAVLTMESRDEEIGFSMFGDLGFHVKGSQQVFRSGVSNIGGQLIERPRRSFRQPFNNVSAVVGVKKTGQFTDFINYYFGVGARGDYNLSYDTSGYSNNNDFYDEYLNKITYGISIVGGLEYTVGDTGLLFIELSFSPDFSKQINVPPGLMYTHPITNIPIQLGKQEIINRALEISVGYKFVRWN